MTSSRTCKAYVGLATKMVALMLSTGTATASGSGFLDTFETFDPIRWMVSDGWANGDHQNCEWSNREVRVRKQRARLRFTHRPMPLRKNACAEIQSRERFGFGTYEARLRTPAGSGLNAAFFTYIGKPTKTPHDEIDFEFLLKDTSRVQLNTHVAGKGGNEYLAPLPRPADAAFQNYAFVWKPDSVTFFVNGEEVHRIDEPAKVPKRPSKIYFSLWGTDTLKSWMGPFKPPPRPVALEIDRVSFTPLGERCPRGASVCAGRL